VASPAFPLSAWAGVQIQTLARETGSPRIAALTGAGMLVERAAQNGFSVPGLVSAGGGCRLYQAQDGWIALSLARPDDRMLVPALLKDATLDPQDDAGLFKRLASARAQDLVDQGAALGMAIAGVEENAAAPVSEIICRGQPATRTPGPPLVIDLSALWAGPLATHLLQMAGATVIKVESSSRPDAMRGGDPDFFNLLNQDKASIALNLREKEGRAALLSLIRKSDIVIESSRPRALLQMGIDADALVQQKPGLVWISITGHGMRGNAANRIGFGDDCAVAGGLSAALLKASGCMGFVGDAIADPLSGLVAARLAWSHWASGIGARLALSMSGIVAQACAEEKGLDVQLRRWANARGRPFSATRPRQRSPARQFGADNEEWLSC
jgi:hypothetical protein